MKTQNLNNIEVRDVMSKQVITVNQNALLEEIDKIFREELIHHVPVVNDRSELVGVVSKSDIQLMKDWGTRLNLNSAKKRNELLFGSQMASDIMTKKLVTVQEDCELSYCAEIFRKNIFHCIPVVNQNELVGIITTYDLINVAFKPIPIT